MFFVDYCTKRFPSLRWYSNLSFLRQKSHLITHEIPNPFGIKINSFFSTLDLLWTRVTWGLRSWENVQIQVHYQALNHTNVWEWATHTLALHFIFPHRYISNWLKKGKQTKVLMGIKGHLWHKEEVSSDKVGWPTYHKSIKMELFD